MKSIIFAGLLGSLLVIGPTVAAQHHNHASQHDSPTSQVDAVFGQVRYVCPMHSHIVKDHPGNCPICGMALEPVTLSSSAEDDGPSIRVSGQIQQAMSVKTAMVERDDLWKYIKTLGTVSFDQSSIHHVHPRASGWLEQLTAHAVGERVEQGELLFTLYSPELVVAQDDYLQVLHNASGASRASLLQQARLRLSLLGIDEKVISGIEKSGRALYTVPFYAQQSGVITALNVRHGMYVTPDVEMLAISDLQKLWVIADVFESQFDWLKLGKPAEISLAALGVHALEANIDYIYPQLDPVTRSLKVRLSVNNPLERIKPGMTADVAIFGGPLRDVLVIDKQAVIQTGEGQRVVVKSSDDSFTVRKVQTGMQARGRVEILSGLAEGEEVVVSGQFLLDSEASLAAGMQRLEGAGHNH
ncbi:efflux RND transporter periplasmic adaptor subunit [Bowmanella denitrificans]|uniref:Efflux RND transporter periplasmic adaptor subunit n=1 Tax=Bowmanella denitrificans TaxID=366582 RepID=A0ABN0X3J5_9ALTE